EAQHRGSARDQGRRAEERSARAPRRRQRLERAGARDGAGAGPREVRGSRAAAGGRIPPRGRGAPARRRGRRGRRRGPGMSITMSQLQQLPLRHLRRGKVREVYEVDAGRLLLVATDRVSAFDVVMKEPVPHKGAVLTQMTAWWLRQLEQQSSSSAAPALRHHMISADIDTIIAQVPTLLMHREQLRGRAMLCIRTEVFPVECVVRGYISGSAWKEYRSNGTLAGEALPAGLVESDRFDPPRFSPATKAETGHDENIPVAEVRRRLGPAVGDALESMSRLVYARGRDVAAARGIIIADTKFEFGRDAGGTIRLI